MIWRAMKSWFTPRKEAVVILRRQRYDGGIRDGGVVQCQCFRTDPARTAKSRQRLSAGVSLLFFLGLALAGTAAPQSIRNSPWTELLQGRAVAIIRHAIAPGVGDPTGFHVEDCTTQRNLSDEGRAQARRIGSYFRQKGIRKASVYSSQWCRCLETAKLIDLGKVSVFPALNSFFRDGATEQAQTLEVKRMIRALPAGSPTILITHQVNITALTGVYPSSGEIIIFRLEEGGQGSVLGRFKP